MTRLAGYVEEWLNHRVRAGEITHRSYTEMRCRFAALYQVHGDRPIGQLDRTTIRRWQRAVGHHSPATRRSYQSTVGNFCRWLVAENIIDTDPTEGLPRVREPRRVPRARPASDVAKILAAAPSARDRLIVWLMVELGLRAVEVARLEYADFDPAAGTMFVKGKGAHERVLPVPAVVAAAIATYDRPLGASPGPLLCAKHCSHGLTAGTVARVVNGLMRQTGVKRCGGDGISAHSLRHTAASDVLDRCGDVRLVQHMLGHASLATTQIYLRRASLQQLRDAMEGRDYRQPLGSSRGQPPTMMAAGGLGGQSSGGALSPHAGLPAEVGSGSTVAADQ
jgi:site-specific recombinase XerD